MSKLDSDLLLKSIDKMIAFASGEEITNKGETLQGKKRNFKETIELQIGLKNYDPQKDKRFAGTFKLPHVPKPRLNFCMLGNQLHCEEAEKAGIPFLSVDELKKFNKDKKEVKKLAKSYDGFIASSNLIKQIPRYLGPGLNRANKFPTVLQPSESLTAKIKDISSTIKFQMRKVLCMNVAVGHMEMTKEQIMLNVQLAVNFLVSLLKKNWQNVKVLYIKSSMGPSFQIYF